MLASCEEEMLHFGEMFAKELSPGAIVALHGDLGSGKTTLIKGVIHALTGINKHTIQSPTFTYMHTYTGPFPIYHFDLYRLKNEEKFLEMGLLDFFDSEGVCLIEWPIRIESLLPKHPKNNMVHIYLTHAGENKRRIDVQHS